MQVYTFYGFFSFAPLASDFGKILLGSAHMGTIFSQFPALLAISHPPPTAGVLLIFIVATTQRFFKVPEKMHSGEEDRGMAREKA